MRVTLRVKLMGIVAVAAIAMLILAITGAWMDGRVEQRVDDIQQQYLPKIRVRPQLEAAVERVHRALEDAAGAAETERLTTAEVAQRELLAVIDGATDALTHAQRTTLHALADDHHRTGVRVARALIEGDASGELGTLTSALQDARGRLDSAIIEATAFDERGLAEAFAAVDSTQRTGMISRVAIGAACLLILVVLSVLIARNLYATLANLGAGFRRLGEGDFTTQIPSTSDDELGDVAVRANQMAGHLRNLDRERSRATWLKSGLAGLAEEIRGDLSPAEIATRAMAFLTRYLEAPAGALYYGPPGGPYRLLAGHGITDEVARTVEHGVGVVGQAVATSDVTVVETPKDPGLTLRTGLTTTLPSSLVFVPLVASERVTGVIELALTQPWTESAGELVTLARETIAIAVEVARGRSATQALLDETRRQAGEIEMARKALEDKADELAKASTYKSQFLASMSHELRTPLNAIIGFSELLQDDSIPLDAAMSKELVGDILTSGRHLLQLINDVLDLSKVEAGKLELFPERIKLTSVIGEVLAILRSTASKQQVTVHTDVPAELDDVTLDPARLKQVLYNYLSNALKFTPPRGRVTVRVRPEGMDRFRLEVEDTGSGIGPEDMSRLFASFQQTTEGARKSGSTGLGLALTKRLVEAQGGSIGVRSELGKGSVFHAVLPRQASSTDAALPPLLVPGDAPDTGKPVVLVIEDDPRDREVLVSSLQAAGFAVEAVSTGKDAVARCRERQYNAITLDLFLPDMTGLEVLQQVRDGRNGKVPVVVVTVVAERGAVAGFAVHDILPKPLDAGMLMASLQRAGVRPDLAPSVILVVDDDPASLKVMSATLGQLGFLAVTESDGRRGLEAALAEPPSAIVLDLIMPGFSGFEFLDQLRASEVGRAIPVIVWTSKDVSMDELQILRTSAHAVVSKGHNGNSRVITELTALLGPGKETSDARHAGPDRR